MKKLVFGLITSALIASFANAWSIEKTEYTDSGITYYVYCGSNGILE